MAKIHLDVLRSDRVAGIALCGMARYGAANIKSREDFFKAPVNDRCGKCSHFFDIQQNPVVTRCFVRRVYS